MKLFKKKKKIEFFINPKVIHVITWVDPFNFNKNEETLITSIGIVVYEDELSVTLSRDRIRSEYASRISIPQSLIKERVTFTKVPLVDDQGYEIMS